MSSPGPPRVSRVPSLHPSLSHTSGRVLFRLEKLLQTERVRLSPLHRRLRNQQRRPWRKSAPARILALALHGYIEHTRRIPKGVRRIVDYRTIGEREALGVRDGDVPHIGSFAKASDALDTQRPCKPRSRTSARGRSYEPAP